MILRTLTVSLMFCVAALPAHAGPRKCDSHSLTSADNTAVHQVIAETAGRREVLWPSMKSCISGSDARTWVRVKEEPQLDGSLIKFYINCEREQDTWICELGKSRSARMVVEFVGRQTTFDLGLPLEFDLQNANILLTSASDVAPKLKVEHQCGHVPYRVRNEHAEDLFRLVQDSFLQIESVVAGQIDRHGNMLSLEVNNSKLIFLRDFEGDPEPEFRCWTHVFPEVLP